MTDSRQKMTILTPKNQAANFVLEKFLKYTDFQRIKIALYYEKIWLFQFLAVILHRKSKQTGI